MNSINSVIIFLILFLFSSIFTNAYSNQGIEEVDNKKAPIHVKSEQMESDNSSNMVAFIGDVVATKGDMTIYADKMDIYTDDTQKQLKKIIASGNVKIIREKMTAICQKAIYEKMEDKLILQGEPVVTENDNVIEGSEIIYFLEKEDIIVRGDGNNMVEVILFTEDLEENYEMKSLSNSTD